MLGNTRGYSLFAFGFTLIEVMVVIVIIGVALAMAVPNLFVSEHEKVRQESERLLALLDQTRDQAVFAGQPIAVRLSETGIEFLQRNAHALSDEWQPAGSRNEAALPWRGTVRATRTVPNASGREVRDARDARGAAIVATSEEAIVFVPAGIAAPFEILVFSTQAGVPTRTIVGDALGNLSAKP